MSALSALPALPRPHAYPTAITPLVCAQGVDSLLTLWAAGLTPATHRTYEKHLTRFATTLGVSLETLPATLLRDRGGTYAAVRRYRGALLARRCAPSTVNGALAALRSLLVVAREAGLIDWTLAVSAVRVVAYRDTRGPAPAVITALLQQADAQPVQWRAARDACVVRLLWELGLRVSELTTIARQHVEWAAGAPVAVWILGKGYHDRTRLALPATSQLALARWIAADPRSASGDGRERDAVIGLTARGVEKLLERLCRVGHLQRCSSHQIRHGAITAALDAGHPPLQVRAFSRHRRLETLLIYFDNRERGADLVATSLATRV